MPVGALIAAAGPAALLSAGVSAGTGILGALTAKSAADSQAKAANKASQTQLKMYEESKANLQPFTDVGKSATYTLADLYGLPSQGNPNGGQPFNPASLAAFENSPDYAFAKQEGINSLDASAASKGGLLGGNQLAAVTQYASGLATQNFGNYASRLAQLAQLGENAAATTGQQGVATGQGMAGTILGAGEANASGTLGAYKAIGNGLQGAFGNLAYPYGSGSAYAPMNLVPPAMNQGVPASTLTPYMMTGAQPGGFNGFLGAQY